VSEEIQNTNQLLAQFFDGLADQLLARTDVVMRASILQPSPGQTTVIPDGTPFDTMVWRLRGSSTSVQAKFYALAVAHDGESYLLSSDHETNAAGELEKLQMMADYLSAGADGAQLFNRQLIDSRPYQNNAAQFQNIGLGQDDEMLLKILLALKSEQRQELLLAMARKMNPPTAEKSINSGDLPVVIGKSGLMIPLGQDLYHNKDGSQMAQSIFMHLQPLSVSDGMSIGVEFYHDFNASEDDSSAAGSIDAVRAQDLLNAIEAGETPPYPNKFDAKQAMASIMAMGNKSYKFVQSLLHAPDPARLAWMKKYLPQIAGGAENENSGAELVRRIAEQIRQQDWPIRTTRARPDCAVIHLGWLESKGGEEIAYYTRFLGIDGNGRCAGFLLPVPPGAKDEDTSASMEVMLKFLSTSRPRPRPEGLEIFDPRDFYEKICSWAQSPQQPAQERIVRTILSMDDKARRGAVFYLIDETLNPGHAKSRQPPRTLPSQERVR